MKLPLHLGVVFVPPAVHNARMSKRIPAAGALLAGLLLSSAAPLAALVIIPPFRPFGPVDPALLLDRDAEPIEVMAFEGKVVDEAGEPVAGAEVVLRPVQRCADAEDCGEGDLDPILPTRLARSDAGGLFYLADLDSDPVASLDISAPGFATSTFDLGWLGERHFEKTFRLPRGGGLIFTAVDEKGKPLPAASAMVGATGDGINLTYLLLAEVDESWTAAREDGSIRFTGLAAGLSNLLVRAEGKRVAQVGVSIPAGGEPLDLGKIELLPAGKLRGKVVDENGEPIQMATVRSQLAVEPLPETQYATGIETQTDELGNFELAWSYPESFEFLLLAMAEGHSSTHLAFTSEPAAPIELRLAGRRALAGQVVRKDSSEPLAACSLFTTLVGPNVGADDFDSAETDAGGHFELASAPLGAFDLNCECGGAWTTLRVDETTPLPLRLEMAMGTFIHGRLIGPSEVVLEGASVTFKDKIAWVDAEGIFSLDNVEPGEGELLVDRTGRSFVVPIVVPAEGLEDLEVRTPEDGDLATLTGTVYDPLGRPTTSWIQVYTESGAHLATGMTRGDGTFEIPDLQPGKSRLVAQWQTIYYFAEVELKKIMPSLDIHFPSGSTLRGKLENYPSTDSSRLFVRAFRELPGVGSQVLSEEIYGKLDATGHFTFEHIPEGDWKLTAGVVGRSLMTQSEVSIEGKDTEEVTLRLESVD